MNKKITKLMAALALLLFMTPAMVGWGQTSLATWTFTSTNYPSNKTNFYATGGPCTNSTFYLNGSGSTWNSNKGYAFTSVTDIDITLVLDRAVSSGETVSFSAVMFYNKASNAPMKGFNLTVKEGNGSYSTTGLSVTSWSLSTSATTYNVDYTIQSSLSSGSSIALKLTGTGSAGSGQGYMNDIAIVYTDGGTPTPTTYTVTYDANGGTGTMTDSNSPYNAGATVTVLDNAFTRDNYTFDHWNTSADNSGTNYDEGDTFTINANTTLYAQWTEDTPPTPGGETLTFDFEENTAHRVSGNNNYSSTNTYQENDATITLTYADAITTGSPLNGSANVLGRVAKSTTNSPIIHIGSIDITNKTITSIAYDTKGVATMSQVLEYSLDNSTWTNILTLSSMPTSKTTETASGLSITGNDLYLRWTTSVSSSTNSNRDFQLDDIVITYTTSSNPVPTISANNVEITYDATSGQIIYTLNDQGTTGTVSASVPSGSWITLPQTSSSPINFTCTANPNTEARSETVTLTYTYGNNETVTKDVTVTQAAVPMTYTTIPALFEAATSDETPVFVTFNNWVVSGVSTNGKSVYVTDNTGNGFVIYFTSDMSGTFAAGNILSGTAVACELKLYNGAAELVNLTATDLTITSGGTVSIFNIPMSDLSGVNTGALVSYDNLTCSMNGNNYILSDGTTTLQAYNTLYAFNEFEADKTYNVTGVYVQYNSIKEIAPRSAADIQEVQVQHNEYTLTVGNPAHITLTVGYGTDGVLTNGENDDIEDGTEITVTVNVETGYLLDEITVSGTNNQTVTVTETSTPGVYTFYMPAFDATLTATAVEYVAPAAGSYVRITSLDQLTNGSKVIIAARYNSTANAYAAMPNVLASNTNHGKPNGVAFTSTISGTNEVLPDAIVNEEATYYWTVGVNDNVYTFTSANGNMIGWAENTDFSFANGAHKDWTVERVQAGSGNMVSNYTGFLIKNQNTTTRAFAYNGSQFGAYSTTANLNNSSYNFFLDFFVQDEPQTYTMDITGWDHAEEGVSNFYLIASPIGDVNPADVTIISREDENVIPADVTTMVSGSYDLYYFDHNRDKEWVNYIDASNTPGAFNTLESGKGYLYANLYDVTLVFRGTGITSGEQTIPLDYYEEGDGFTIDLPGWNLLGNPFAKTAYLTTSNSGITTSFYTMDERGNYISVTNGSIDPMEGIFVHAVGEGQSVTFTTTAPSKSPVLNLNLSNGRRVVDRAIVRFDRGNQLPKLQFRQGSTKVYIPVEGHDYAVVSCEEMGELPVSFKAEENGSYNLSLSSEEVSFAYLHLIDNMTGADVDLLQTPSYSFEARTTDYANRFKLVFATGDNSNDDNFAFFSNGSFVINNDGAATLQVIDVTGRIVKSESINGCTNVNVNAASGVYMLRLINGDNVKVQKVVVK